MHVKSASAMPSSECEAFACKPPPARFLAGWLIALAEEILRQVLNAIAVQEELAVAKAAK